MKMPPDGTILDKPDTPCAADGGMAQGTSENSCDSQALIQAFLKGAGLPNVALPGGLTPEWMEMIGQLLAISVQGTVELAALRSLVKREANAEQTMVVVRNNNPLKFFSDGQTVLTQMLRKRMPGFMGPVEAMEDAHQDLHAHQLGMVAGTKAAMIDTLRRLNPKTLESEIPSYAFIDNLFPLYRKARLWDGYRKRFKEAKKELRNDSSGVFGKAFLDAYEQEVDHFRNNTEKDA
jgi:FHA domain-containing protein